MKRVLDDGFHMFDSLYAISGVTTGLVKIGRSLSPIARLQDMRTSSPDQLVMVAWARGMGELETDIHKRHAKERIHGEWFSARLLEKIHAAIRLDNDPSEPSDRFAFWVAGKHGRNWHRAHNEARAESDREHLRKQREKHGAVWR